MNNPIDKAYLQGFEDGFQRGRERSEGLYDAGFSDGQSNEQADWDFWLSEIVGVPDGASLVSMKEAVQNLVNRCIQYPDDWYEYR